MDQDEFDLVFTLCKDALSSFHGRKKTRFIETKKCYSRSYLSRHNLLTLALQSLWKNPTIMELSETFRTPTTTIIDTRSRLFPLVERCLRDFVQVPTSYPRFVGGPLARSCAILDTTPTPIPKPTLREDRKLYFNFKKKPTPFALKTQIVLGFDLKIWSVSDTYPHSVHDLNVLRRSEIYPLLSDKKKGLGDAAYQGDPTMIAPFKKPRGGELKRSQKLFNKQLSHVRVAVENVFKRVKDWKVISDVYRGNYHNLDEFNCIFKLVCSLVNITFQNHPLRREQRALKKLPYYVGTDN